MGRRIANTDSGRIIDNPTYDVLKFVALVVLPALNTLWLGVAQIWNLPYIVEIATTIALLDAFLGAVLKLSTDRYHNEETKAREAADADGPDHLAEGPA